MKLRYKTLKGLIKKTNQFTLNSYMGKRIYHINKGHRDITLSKDLNKEIENLFISFLGISNLNKHNFEGIFDRLIISKRSLNVEYIAGQNYPSELRFIKKLLK